MILLTKNRNRRSPDVAHSGLHISPRFLALSRGKFPHVTYYDVDVLEGVSGLPTFDYIVMNGLFNLMSITIRAEGRHPGVRPGRRQ
jgi:hypothetical protein